jgi:tight adherence protein B
MNRHRSHTLLIVPLLALVSALAISLWAPPASGQGDPSVVAGTPKTSITPSTEPEIVASEPLPIESIDLRNFPEVQAIVSAPNIAAIDSIGAQSFRVLERGAGGLFEQRAVGVNRLVSSELSVVLVIDTSASMSGTAIQAAKNAATAFVRTMPASVPVAIVGFGTSPRVHSTFTTDRAKTVQALADLRTKGHTTLYDAIIKGASLFQAQPKNLNIRQRMVVLTDGGDTRSTASISQVTDVLRNSDFILSAVALSTRESDRAALSLLASSANGTVVSATDPAALNGVFDDIASTVLNQYELVWSSKGNGATDVQVDLGVDGKTYRNTTSVGFPVKLEAQISGPQIPGLHDASRTPRQTPLSPTVKRASDRGLLVLGIASGFGAMLCAALVMLWPRAAKRRLAAEYGQTPRQELRGSTKRLLAYTDRFLERRSRRQRLQSLLERAGMRTDPATAAVFVGIAWVLAFILGLAFTSFLMAIALGLFAVGTLFGVVVSKANKRSNAFQQQLETTLQVMSNSLKAGYGISQAIDTVAQESESPTGEEFRRIVRETRLGMDQIEALQSCADRVNCEDLRWITDAIAVNREVGGNLTELFAGVSETLRARSRLARQVSALSAEGRISARILIALPFVVVAWMSVTNRSYIGELFKGSRIFLLLLGGILMTIGYFWTRRITQVRY